MSSLPLSQTTRSFGVDNSQMGFSVMLNWHEAEEGIGGREGGKEGGWKQGVSVHAQTLTRNMRFGRSNHEQLSE